jgi:hypothetical protein
MDQRFSRDCWDHVVEALACVRERRDWDLRMAWLMVRDLSAGEVWPLVGGLLSLCLPNFITLDSLRRDGVGLLANECWMANRLWLSAPESLYYDALSSLTRATTRLDDSPADGYIFLVIIAQLLTHFDSPDSVLAFARTSLVATSV